MATKLPKLEFDGFFLTGEVRLAAWGAFGDAPRRGPEVTIEVEVPSEVLDALGEGEDAELTAAQCAALLELVERQEAVRDAATAAMLAHYQQLRPRILEYFEDTAAVPDVHDVEGFRALVDLRSINLHRTERDGYAYHGLLFGCSWDEEHGTGVMMHRDRVVDVGGADTAILQWIADRDARGDEPAPERAVRRAKPTKKTAAKKKR